MVHGAADAFQAGEQPRPGSLLVAGSHAGDDRYVLAVVGEELDDAEGRVVCPVEVLQDQQRRARTGEVAEQAQHRLRDDDRWLRRRGPAVGTPVRQQRPQHRQERHHIRALRPGQVAGSHEQGLADRSKRRPGGLGTRPADQRRESPVAGHPQRLGRQPGLADARLAGQGDHLTPTAHRRRQRGGQRRHDLTTTDQDRTPHPAIVHIPSPATARVRPWLLGLRRRPTMHGTAPVGARANVHSQVQPLNALSVHGI